MRRASLLLAGLAALALTSCKQPPAEDPTLLFDRVWIDKKPDKPTDFAHVAYVLPRPAIGFFQRASAYEVHAERFDHAREGRRLGLTFPQSGKKAEIDFTITACSELPPFDLCLDLSANPWGGPKRYYGMRDQDEDDATLRSLRARIPRR